MKPSDEAKLRARICDLETAVAMLVATVDELLRYQPHSVRQSVANELRRRGLDGRGDEEPDNEEEPDL